MPETIIDAFLRQVEPQYDPVKKEITLGANINADVANLLQYAHTASVALTNASLFSTATQVTIAGTGTIANLGGAQVVELVATAAGDALGLTLTARPAGAFNLRSILPGFPSSQEATNAGLIVTGDSLFYQFDYQHPKWLLTDIEPPKGVIYPALGLNLEADIDISSRFARVAVLTGASVVTFRGPVTYPAAGAQPEMYLDAVFPGFTMAIGPLAMRDFHVITRTVSYLDEPQYNHTGNLFTGILDIGQGVEARIGADTQIVPPDRPNSSSWTFTSDFGPGGLSLEAGLQALAVFVGGDSSSFILPDSIRALGTFGLTQITVGVNPLDFTDIQFVFIEVGSPKEWKPPIPYTTIENLHAQWQIVKPFDPQGGEQSGGFGGTIKFGTEKPVHLDVLAMLPKFMLNANLREGDEISVVDALSTFFPDAGGLSQDLIIDQLNIFANFYYKNYEFAGSIKPVPPFSIDLVITTLSLERVSLTVNYNQDQLYGTVLGFLRLFDAQWQVSAAYQGPGSDDGAPSGGGNWIFLVRLSEGEQIDLTKLVLGDGDHKFLDFEPAYIPQVTLEGLFFQYNLANRTYTFRGAIKGYWELPIPDITLKVLAETSVSSFIEEQTTKYQGFVRGSFAVNDLAVGAGYAFEPTSTTLSFSIEYKRIALYATLTRTTKKVEGQDQTTSILRISFGDLSLGEIIEYLVNLASPGSDFKLEPPWDILNSLTLKNLSLVIDLTNKTAGIEYRLDLQLAIVYLESVSLTYLQKPSGKTSVEMGIKGRFLDQSFGEGDELKWDLLDDPAPAVPGRGNKLFDLQFLAIGHHVALQNPGAFDTVSDVIKALEQNMKPVADPKKNPLAQPAQQSLVFDKDSGWLFGARFVVLGGIDVSIIFNDPYLYGILLQLSGDVAGALSGLRFELLYKRISDSLGVFKVVLRVPDQFRQLEFGEVSITLPTIKVDIYTNGNFRVDLGFPTGGDFTESFGLQVFPFIGKGGFYFGYLTGATSTAVPKITNGEFSPVLELGLGLAVGLGKEISEGPLKAGLSLTLQAFVEGALAWFHPYTDSANTSMYFWMRGTAAIIGTLYGAVDFKVIKVSVSVVARASVTLTIESHKPITVELNLSVAVNASVKILFVNIKFSFNLDLDLSFSIGSASPTPWIVDPSAPAPHLPSGAARKRAAMAPLGRQQGVVRRATRTSARLAMASPLNRISAAAMRRMGPQRQTAIQPRLREEQMPAAMRTTTRLAVRSLAEVPEPKPAFNWQPRQVFSAVQSMPTLVIPALTVSDNASLLPEDRTEAATSNQLVLTFLIENGMSAGANSLAELSRVTAESSHSASDPTDLPFSLMVEGMLAWSIASFLHPAGGADPLEGDIDRLELEALVVALEKADLEGDAFTAPELQAFLDANYLFRIGAYTGDASAVNETSATFMPVPPPLTLGLPGKSPIDFSTYRQVGDRYEDTVASYFAATSIDYGVNIAPNPFGHRTTTPSSGTTESMAQMIGRDYYLMLARGAAQAALGLMESFPRAVTSADSLQGVAGGVTRVAMDHVVRSGETTETLTKTYFMTLEELETLNPGVDFSAPLASGIHIQVLEGPTVESIVEANKSLKGLLKSGAKVPIAGARYPVQQTDSLTSIASLLGIDVGLLVTTNADATLLLEVGSLFALPAFTYTSVAGDTLAFIAAFLLVRNGRDPADKSQEWYSLAPFAWYEQTIAMLNYDNAGQFVDFDKPIPPGTPIKVPPAYLQSDSKQALTYTSRAGDTLERIAGYYVLLQNPTPGYTAFLKGLSVSGSGTQPGPGDALPVSTAVSVPKWTHKIQTVDSFRRFTGALGLTLANIGGSSSFGDPAVLADLALLDVPSFDYTLPDDQQTFTSVAARFSVDLDHLALSLQAATGYFNDTVLQVPNLASISVRSLLDAVLRDPKVNEIARSASRFMLHGLRLPLPPANPADPVDTSTLYGLYELVGQQVSIDQLTLPLDITLTTSDAPVTPGQSGGIELYTTYAVTEDDTFKSLLETYSELLKFNPGLNEKNFKAGLLLFVTRQPSLTLTVDQAFLDANGASSNLTLSWLGPDPAHPIVPLPLSASNPVRYTLARPIRWQTTKAPPYAGQPAGDGAPGEPSIWLFPAALLAKVLSGATGDKAYGLLAGVIDDRGRMQTTPVERYDWATLIEIGIKKVPGAPPLPPSRTPVQQPPPDAQNPFLPHTYELLPGNGATQSLLLNLWSHIQGNAGEASALIRILYAPSAQSDNPDGLASLAEDAAGTFILKSNLSTLSTSGASSGALAQAEARLATREEPEGQAALRAATIAEAGDFLELLWESGVVGTGGYFLNYAAGGEGLPDSIFDEQNTAKLRLLVILPSQSAPANATRVLYAFNNCAVSADNPGTGGANVFVERADGAETVASAVAPPGVYAFAGTRKDPGATPPPPDPGKPDAGESDAGKSGANEWRTQVLYSFLGYRVPASNGFAASNDALPIGAAVPPDMMDQFRDSKSDQSYPWYYSQNVPAYELATTHALSASPHLPDRMRDPYAGVGAKSTIAVDFSVHDLYGNVLTPTNAIPAAALDVRYTDDLIALSEWPGTTTSYDFTGVQDPTTKIYVKAAIRVSLGFQTANYVPGAGTTFDRAQYNVSAHRLKYGQVYYQIEQPGIGLSLTTSLIHNPADPSNAYPLNLTAVRQFVQAVYVFLGAASQVQQVVQTVQSVAGETISFNSLGQQYPITLVGVGEANQNVELRTLFAEVRIPAYVAFPQQGTLAGVAAASGIAGLDAGTLAAQNTRVPLSPGVVLVTPQRSFTALANKTLEEMASTNTTTVENIALTNAPTPNLLTEGMPVVVDGVTLTVQQGESIDDLVTRFASAGIPTNPVDLAIANERTPGLIATGASLATTAYVIRAQDTFASITKAFPAWTAQVLGTASKDVPNVILRGVNVYLGEGSVVAPAPGDTFARVSLVYALAVPELVLANADRALLDGARVKLPGLASTDATADDPVYVPYSVPADALFGTVATNLGQTSAGAQAALVETNQYTPDLLHSGVVIQIDNQSTTTAKGATFASVLAALNQGGSQFSYGDLAAAIGSTPGLLQEGGTLVTPMPPLPAGKSLAEAAQAFHVSLQALAVANAAMTGLIQAGVEVTVRAGSPAAEVKLTTQSGETFATLVQRFLAEQQVIVTVEDIATAVAPSATFLIGGAQVLLPPRTTTVEATLYTSVPEPPPYPGTTFELLTAVTLARPADTIHPDFANAPKVRSVTTGIAPHLDTDASGAYLLNGFAMTFEAIFAGLKLAVGDGQSTGDDRRIPHLFAVNFSSSGFQRVEITPGDPAVFAIRPIATRRMSARGVDIQPLSDDGTLGTAVKQDFDAVDLDVWAADLLASIDLFLSAGIATTAYSLDEDSLLGVLQAKESLAKTITYGLSPVIQGSPSDGLTVAQERLEQALLVSLAEGYAINAVLQYPSTVQAPAGVSANLSGKPVVVLDSDQPGATQGVFHLALTSASTFESIEAFFGLSLDAIVGQIRTLSPLLAADGVFRFPDQAPYTVPNATTTLDDVAAHFGLTDPTPLAEFNRMVPGLFQAVTLSITMPVPDFTISTARTSLANGSGFVTFLLKVPKERQHKALLLHTDYQINEVELDIAPVPNTGGFNRSSWLSFVIPISSDNPLAAIPSTDLGQADVPLVLRSYPDLPVLVEQSFGGPGALPPDFPGNIEKAREWSYVFSYEQNAAVQDSTYVSIFVNQEFSADTEAEASAKLRRLFEALAQWSAVYPVLLPLILDLLDPKAVSDKRDLLKNAIATFRTLVDGVKTAWEAYWAPSVDALAFAAGLEPEVFEFEAIPILNPLTTPPTLSDLVLVAQNSAGYPFEQYPRIWFFDKKQDKLVELGKQPTTNDREVVYTYPAGVAAFQPLVHRYELPGLNAVSQQNASGELVVKRNLELLPGKTTAPEFVYETPAIAFTNSVFPAIVRNDLINARTTPGETLAEVIDAIFTNLLGPSPANYSMKIVVRYGFALAAPPGGAGPAVLSEAAILSEIPVLFQPRFTYSPVFAADLVRALDDWYGKRQAVLSGQKGAYIFELTVFSSLDANLQQPVLTLKRVVFPLQG